MADIATNNIADYIKGIGINISALSRNSGVSDNILRRSIVNKDRSLRFSEAIAICNAIGKNPLDFYPGSAGGSLDTGQPSA